MALRTQSRHKHGELSDDQIRERRTQLRRSKDRRFRGLAKTLDELVRAGSLLSHDPNFRYMASILVEQTLDISKSDLACLYIRSDPEHRSDLNLIHRRGRYQVPERLSRHSELVQFVEEAGETVVLLERKPSPFLELLLDSRMQCGIGLPIATPTARLGILILNSLNPNFYNRERFDFLDSFAKLAGGMLHNSRMYLDLRETLRRVEELERYQENIFSSMTNLLLTTDGRGRIRYFNRAAGERLGLSESDIGNDLGEYFAGKIGRRILREIDSARRDRLEILDMEGIYKDPQREMDFSLNLSPLLGRRGGHEGITLLFTDQSREKELQEKMEQVVEERRLIKDMFARYLSTEVVSRLVESPDLVKPGGDKKVATIFFADIRGYTSFSEGREPEYIIDVLNEYFSEAVEVVIRHKGYIDKFIGDCIMAAWGVPLQTEEEDAVQAVSCALEIQELVRSKQRSFFRGEASKLKIGIGMHTGPIVAGNLGSSRRMNYTVIGDTVNVAARLEGVAEADEVIITQHTCDYIRDHFKLEKRKPVKVKGKIQPIPIYRVLRKVS
ncbi:MAG: guanylate cyclase [Spirochaetaceae bacterium]|nr:MAG: guanylate cyclase [Spirochaetaceae bacterium]